jgi:hypothetical protein
MLVDPVANVLPVYDTTALHAQAAVEWILAKAATAAQEPERAEAVAG